MPCDTSTIRADFPILDREVRGSPLIYLDNAATTQTPRQVYEVFESFYSQYNANVHRGIHSLSHEASVAYEQAHDRAAEFIGASGGRRELVFTKNTTEAVNLVAQGLAATEIGQEDTVVTTVMDHHATLVTCQQIAEQTGASIEYIGVTDEGGLDMEDAKRCIDEDTALVAVTHVSNVLGTVNPVDELATMAHEHDARILVDGAQSVPTRPVDVEALEVDFFTFSGHKLLGPTGIGALYGRADLLEALPPVLYGGAMIESVSLSGATWNDPPWKFEAGTPPIAEGIALGAAIEYLADIGMETVREHEAELGQELCSALERRDHVETYGPPSTAERSGLVSFNVEGVHGHDLSALLNDRGIAVRAGDHCTQPLHEALDVPGSVRASVYVYTTTEEIDRLLSVIDEAREALPEYLASDRFHDDISAHQSRDHNRPVPEDASITVSQRELNCGDEAAFGIEVTDAHQIDRITYETESCAVSRAASSILAEYLTGRPVAELEESDGIIEELLDGQFPDLRRECVTGPEEALRAGVEAYLHERPPTQK